MTQSALGVNGNVTVERIRAQKIGHLEIALFHTRDSTGETVQMLVSSATLRINEYGY